MRAQSSRASMCGAVRLLVVPMGICTYLRIKIAREILIVPNIPTRGFALAWKAMLAGLLAFEAGGSTRTPIRVGASAYYCCYCSCMLLVLLLLFVVAAAAGGFDCW